MGHSRFRWPDPPSNIEQMPDWARELVRFLEQDAQEDSQPINAQTYVVSNYTPTRTLDASTATVSDVADVLCTLIADFIEAGTLKG